MELFLTLLAADLPGNVRQLRRVMAATVAANYRAGMPELTPRSPPSSRLQGPRPDDPAAATRDGGPLGPDDLVALLGVWLPREG